MHDHGSGGYPLRQWLFSVWCLLPHDFSRGTTKSEFANNGCRPSEVQPQLVQLWQSVFVVVGDMARRGPWQRKLGCKSIHVVASVCVDTGANIGQYGTLQGCCLCLKWRGQRSHWFVFDVDCWCLVSIFCNLVNFPVPLLQRTLDRGTMGNDARQGLCQDRQERGLWKIASGEYTSCNDWSIEEPIGGFWGRYVEQPVVEWLVVVVVVVVGVVPVVVAAYCFV
jgi:hypothetical protein